MIRFLIVAVTIILTLGICYQLTPNQKIEQKADKSIELPVSFEKLRLRLGDKDFLSEAVSIANGSIIYRAEAERDFKLIRLQPLTWTLDIHEHFIVNIDGKQVPLYSDTSVRPDYIHTVVSLADPSVFYGVDSFKNDIIIYPLGKDKTFVTIHSSVIIQEKIPPRMQPYVENYAKPQLEKVCEQTCKAIIYASQKNISFFENFLEGFKEKRSELK